MPDWITTAWHLVASVIVVAGVPAAVAKFVSDHSSAKWLQQNKSKLDEALETHRAALAKETESHKLTLKRQELLYQRELEAADAFMKVWSALAPAHRMPDMAWDDACEDVAESLGEVEKVLDQYIEQHAIAISDRVRELIDVARTAAATEKFFESGPEISPPKSAVTAAGIVLDNLREARDAILTDLRR